MNRDEQWIRIRNAINKSVEKTIGEKKRVRNEWFDHECMEAINKKK